MEIISKMVQADPKCVDSRDVMGSTPLHVAACYGRTDIMKVLIAGGASLNARDNYMSTPLVVVNSSAKAVELLVSFGADIDASNTNNFSARSMSDSNPYVALAIQQGMKRLRKRKGGTRKVLLSLFSSAENSRETEGNLFLFHTPSFSPEMAPLSPMVPLSLSLSPSIRPSLYSTSPTEKSPLISPKEGKGSDWLTADTPTTPLSISPFSLSPFVAELIVDFLYPPDTHLGGIEPPEPLDLP